jgi:carbamoyltransferase
MYEETGVVHLETERISRIKYDARNPILSFCESFPERIDRFPVIAIEDGHYVAPLVRRVFREPQLANDRGGLLRLLDAARAGPGSDMPDTASLALPPCPETAELVQKFFYHLLENSPQIYFCGHHAAHAANAFFSSGCESALTLTLDGGGPDYPLETLGSDRPMVIYGAVYRCHGTVCQPIAQLIDKSFGWAWVRATALLGLGWGEEGTAMAMAALGDPFRFMREMREPFLWLPNFATLSPADAEKAQAFLSSVRKSVSSDQDRYDLAAALQAMTEERVANWMRPFVGPEVSDLCVSGGVFLNCQLLGKIRDWFPQLRNIFIPPAPYDGGISIGVAQSVLHSRLGFCETIASRGMAPFAMGRSYSRPEILAACTSAGLIAQPCDALDIVDLMERGKIIGLFAGPSESGRRALGNRSIIADPRNQQIKDKINQEIKHRQWFRPLAPMLLAEEVGQWCEYTTDLVSPYMSFAVPIRKELRARVPAILHLDGTARVQTVHPQLSPALHALLSHWYRRTGIPMLLNTSYNDREPIVETPSDALGTFLRVPVDAVYFMDCGLIVVRPATEASR